MRLVVCLLVLALAAAEVIDEPWYEEEDVDESYDDDEEHYRQKREVYDPNADHTRVKRCELERSRRSVDQQYQVHEYTDENLDPSSPPYEEMLAASANHYQRYVAPPKTARLLDYNVAPAVIKTAQLVVPQNQDVQYIPIAAGPISVAAVDGPAPVRAAALSQPLKQLAPGDLFGSPSGHHKAHSHGYSQGGGHGNHGHHYDDHGGKTSKGFSNDHHVDRGNKGYRIDENHRKEYEEAAGKKKKHHDHAGHKGSHEEEAYGSRGAHFDEKKGHKKGHKTKGYHNKYHKDEFQKEHKFYDDLHKSGEHHRYGKFHAKHASNESGKKKAHRVDAGHDFVERGKKGYSNKGHMDADHKGYDGKSGHEEHHGHHSQHGRKGGKDDASHWGYAKNH